MPRKRVVEIKKEVKDNIEEYFSPNVLRTAQQIFQAGEEAYDEDELLSLQEAYDYLRKHGYNISFRAFGGRVERGRIKTVKKGRKRYVPLSELKKMLEIANNYYTLSEAYDLYSRYDPSLNFRAFIGRVEKGSIPSVKIGTSRLIPKRVVEGLVKLAKNYMTVSQVVEELKKHGIKLRRNALERRLDRGRIPFVKVGGKRYIHKDVVKELIDLEKSRRRG